MYPIEKMNFLTVIIQENELKIYTLLHFKPFAMWWHFRVGRKSLGNSLASRCVGHGFDWHFSGLLPID
jgi:hypothetical protein